MTYKTTTSTSHWCDECGEYFGLSSPGVVLETRNGSTLRICAVCLGEMTEDCEAVAQRELLKVGA